MAAQTMEGGSVWDLGRFLAQKDRLLTTLKVLYKELRVAFSKAENSRVQPSSPDADRLVSLAKLYWVSVTAANQDSFARKCDVNRLVSNAITIADESELSVRERDKLKLEAELQRIWNLSGSNTPLQELSTGDFPIIPSLSSILRVDEPVSTVHTRFVEVE